PPPQPSPLSLHDALPIFIFAGGDNRLADVVAVTIASGATLNINNNSDTIGSLAGAGTLTNAGNASDTITFGGLNTDTVFSGTLRSEEHTSELQSRENLVC